MFTGWIRDDQNASDSTEAAASLGEPSGELSRNKGNCSSKHRTTYNAGVISGASKWVEDEEGGGGGGGKTQQVGIRLPPIMATGDVSKDHSGTRV